MENRLLPKSWPQVSKLRTGDSRDCTIIPPIFLSLRRFNLEVFESEVCKQDGPYMTIQHVRYGWWNVKMQYRWGPQKEAGAPCRCLGASAWRIFTLDFGSQPERVQLMLAFSFHWCRMVHIKIPTSPGWMEVVTMVTMVATFGHVLRSARELLEENKQLIEEKKEQKAPMRLTASPCCHATCFCFPCLGW